MRILLLTAIMMIFAGSASAGLYKWVDSDGNVHYSQKPPRDQQFERLKPPAAAPEDSKPLYQSAPTKNTVIPPPATETKKNEKLRAENCANAKKRLSIYQVYRRVRDDEGNITVLSDKERAKNIENAKKAVSDFCN